MLTPPREQQSRCVDLGRVTCHAADLTFSACASTRPSDLDAHLAPHNQFFPIDGPTDGELGLMISHDSTGPLRLGYGGWRDLLLGVQFEDGRGRLITVGGRVMKNVAGYDLTKFMVGQRGVFGRVITFTARTYKRPAAALAARFSTTPDLTHLRPTPAWVIETRGATWAGWLGDEPLIDFASGLLSHHSGVQLIRQHLADDTALRHRLWSLPPTDNTTLLQAALPVGKVAAFILENRIKEWVADPWHGTVLLHADTAQLPALRRSAWHAGGRAEAPSLPVLTTPIEAALLRRLKQQFDPDNTLSPLELEVVP